MKKNYFILIFGILCFPLAIFVFGNTENIGPLVLSIGLISTVYSLIKLSQRHPGIKSFFRALVEFL